MLSHVMSTTVWYFARRLFHNLITQLGFTNFDMTSMTSTESDSSGDSSVLTGILMTHGMWQTVVTKWHSVEWTSLALCRSTQSWTVSDTVPYDSRHPWHYDTVSAVTPVTYCYWLWQYLTSDTVPPVVKAPLQTAQRHCIRQRVTVTAAAQTTQSRVP